jgi:hypothetical protein
VVQPARELRPARLRAQQLAPQLAAGDLPLRGDEADLVADGVEHVVRTAAGVVQVEEP